MEYKRASSPESQQQVKFKPRLIIHGGAGNIPSRDKMLPETYAAYRKSLLTIVGWPVYFYSFHKYILSICLSERSKQHVQRKGFLKGRLASR